MKRVGRCLLEVKMVLLRKRERQRQQVLLEKEGLLREERVLLDLQKYRE
jgi:hypothetical protein